MRKFNPFKADVKKQPSEVFIKKAVINYFAKFTGKLLFESLFDKFAGL